MVQEAYCYLYENAAAPPRRLWDIFDAYVGAIVPYYASQVNYDFMAKPKSSLVTSESQLITRFVQPISLKN